ncbi:hybrid sensor histidine kinase/response regulator [Paludibacterium purpuratum]|uniref:histidine kinase n=1 Tax=Paludibacterium purpuratum TaxID=1144873 RepID=A0A4R7BBL7_9NEIS|nr:ATP-binding protein [Paludibacterium purpuratum]TDR82053.1 signal transduction histidine kinase [Paludibacterium purpuratum]
MGNTSDYQSAQLTVLQEIVSPAPLVALLLLLLASVGGVGLRLWRTQRRRQAQAEREASASKSSLQALISHEVRTPLTAIARLIELSLEDKADESSRRALQRAAWHATTSLQVLLDDLITQSRLDHNQLNLHPVPCELAGFLEEIRQIYRPIVESRQLALQFETHLQVPVVIIDPLRFRQILQNLLANAVKYTHEGGISLYVATEAAQAGQCRIHVELRDSGIGMPPALRAELDQPFQPAGESRRQQYGGHGLGLFLCRQLIRKMRGEMRVDSQPGDGTTIQLNFTVAVGKLDERVPCTVPTECLTGLNILLVEDELANRTLLERDLAQLGISVTSCADGVEALRLWIKQPFDVVLVDWHLPGMNGPAMARIIRRIERRRASAHQTIIGMTTGSAQIRTGVLFDAGLEKPVLPQVLTQTLRRCLPDPSNREPLNLQVLRKLIRGDAVFGRQFLGAARESVQADLLVLCKGYAAPDTTLLAETLHHLQGVTRLMCNDLITARCIALEKAVLEQDSARIKALLPHVKQDLRTVCLALQTCPHALSETSPAEPQTNKS